MYRSFEQAERRVSLLRRYAGIWPGIVTVLAESRPGARDGEYRLFYDPPLDAQYTRITIPKAAP